VFECPTLALFSARLEGTTQEEKPLMQLAALRGQRRRQQQAARVRAS
jgi:hypothetical protein